VTNFELNTVEQYLVDILKDGKEILFGDDLKERIVKLFNKSDAASRKAIERAAEKKIIQSSKPVSFGRGTFAYCAIGKQITFDELLSITRIKKPPMHRLLSALKKSNGIISYYEGLKITGSPIVITSSKTTSLNSVIEDLNLFKLVVIKTDKNKVKYIVSNSIEELLVDGLMARHYSSMIVDSIFLYDVIGSLKKLNLIDNKRVIYRNRKSPSLGGRHNNFVWDSFAYTKTTGINTFHPLGRGVYDQMALVVMDVVISRTYESFDLDGFLSRIQVLKNNTKKGRKILPIIVYKEIGDETLNRARSFGLITYSMSIFFGSSITEIIDNISVIKMNEYGTQGLTIDPVKVISDSLEIINRTGNQINLQNVIGDFFQSLMFQLFNHIYPNCNIIQTEKLPAMDAADGENKHYEYDFIILSNYRKEVIIVEVKGFNSKSIIRKGDYKTENTLQWFFGKTFPSAKKHYETGYTKNYQIKSCFITSAQYDTEGQSFLQALNLGKQKPYDLNVGYDGKGLLQLVAANGLSILKTTLERYFIIQKNK
jgi:hypothetical protein